MDKIAIKAPWDIPNMMLMLLTVILLTLLLSTILFKHFITTCRRYLLSTGRRPTSDLSVSLSLFSSSGQINRVIQSDISVIANNIDKVFTQVGSLYPFIVQFVSQQRIRKLSYPEFENIR